jgi:uncharacterized protein YdeI (YjbR/CyaY-like superfamily)
MEHETLRPDSFPAYYADSAADWRQWLAVHHARERNVWLILYKKDSGIPSLTYEEARDEALCFGWVDSKPNKRDADSYYLFFAARNPKSNWSRVNKDRIAALEAAGKLAPAGERMVAEAKRSGTWDALNEVEMLIVPDDLATAFSGAGAMARTNWDKFPPSVRRGILEWIFTARRPATREKRIAETARLAQRNERANQYRK